VKVTCPNCRGSHRIPEGNDVRKEQIPCPKCGTNFTIKPIQNQTGTRQKPGISAIRAQSGTQIAEKLPSNKGFRVKTKNGLTHDFATFDTLKRWLSDQDKPEDFQVSAQGAAYRPAAEVIDSISIQEAKNNTLDGLDPSQPLSLEPSPPAGNEWKDDSKREITTQRTARAARAIWLLWGISLILLVLGVSITLTRYGVIDLSSFWPLESLGITYPAMPPEEDPSANQAPRIPINQNLKDRYNQALAHGKRALRDKRFSKAALEFNRALSVHPGSLSAMEGLAKAHNGLGDRERALSIIKRAQSIKDRKNPK
jgi:hypothetical protein